MEKFDKDFYTAVSEKLSETSSCFCLAKWLHVTLHLHCGQCHSCYHSFMHDMPLEAVRKDPSALHNTDYKFERREEMLNGVRPKECQFCWNVEDLGGVSDRVNFSASEWAMPFHDTIDTKNPRTKINPRYVEVSFSNQCNFKCSYCSPSASSQWFKEVEDHGGYPVRDNQFTYLPYRVKEEENEWIQAWWKWLPDLHPDLRVLRVTGGEPLLSENTFKLLDFMTKNPNRELTFAINSNMGVPTKFMNRFIEQTRDLLKNKSVKHFTLFTSIDTWGPQAEYIRNGLDIKTFERNINTFLTECSDAKISFMVTLQCLSLPNFNDFLVKIMELKAKFNRSDFNRVDYSIDQLIKPTHQHLPILTNDFLPYLEKIDKFMQDNINDSLSSLSPRQHDRFKTIRRWMEGQMEYKGVREDRVDFYKFFSRHDQLRKTDFLAVFPEYSKFWELCKFEAEHQ